MKKNILRSKLECTRILNEMQSAGEAAAIAWMADHQDRGACGYAKVTIPREEYSLRRYPGSPFEGRLARGQLPFTMAFCGRYQDANAHDAVARAMSDSLRANGVNAQYSSWMD